MQRQIRKSSMKRNRGRPKYTRQMMLIIHNGCLAVHPVTNMFGFDTESSIIEVTGFSEWGTFEHSHREPADESVLQMCKLVGHAGALVLAPCTLSAPN